MATTAPDVISVNTLVLGVGETLKGLGHNSPSPLMHQQAHRL